MKVSRQSGRRTIEQIAYQLIAGVAPDSLSVLPALCAEFFQSAEVQHRIAREVTGRVRRTPAAFDQSTGELVVQTVLLLLNGIATQVLVDLGYRRLKVLRVWWRRRRMRRQLGRRKAADGARTPVPLFSPEVARQIAAQTRWVAARAGLAPETARRLEQLLAATLTEDSYDD